MSGKEIDTSDEYMGDESNGNFSVDMLPDGFELRNKSIKESVKPIKEPISTPHSKGIQKTLADPNLEPLIAQYLIADDEDEIADICEKMTPEMLEKVDNIIMSHIETVPEGGSYESTKSKRKEPIRYENCPAIFAELGYSFAWNDLSRSVHFTSPHFPKSKQLDSEDENRFHSRFRSYCLDRNYTYNEKFLQKIIEDVAQDYRYHPVFDYFNNLPKWDGKDRLALLGQELQGDKNVGRYLEIWMTGVIKKIREKAETNLVLVIEGPQGIGKSYFTQWLCPLDDFFHSGSVDPSNKDDWIKACENLVWEIGELGATTTRVSFSLLKSFFTDVKRKVRGSYEKKAVEKYSICSFIGTINNLEGFLLDPTGNRRFLVLNLTEIDHGYTAMNKNQLWAQAMEAYKAGKTKLTKEEMKGQSEKNEEMRILSPVEIHLQASIIEDKEGFIRTSDLLVFLKNQGITTNGYTNRQISTFFLKTYKVKSAPKRVKGILAKGYKGFKIK